MMEIEEKNGAVTPVSYLVDGWFSVNPYNWDLPQKFTCIQKQFDISEKFLWAEVSYKIVKMDIWPLNLPNTNTHFKIQMKRKLTNLMICKFPLMGLVGNSNIRKKQSNISPGILGWKTILKLVIIDMYIYTELGYMQIFDFGIQKIPM